MAKRPINDDPMTDGEIAADKLANASVLAPWAHAVGCVCATCSATYESDRRDPRG